jgi:uncharacterized membrane protein YkvA (DUF1232 family)
MGIEPLSRSPTPANGEGRQAPRSAIEPGESAFTSDLERQVYMRRLLLLWRVGRNDLRLLWFALRHPGRPVWLLPAAGLLALFALEPANFAVPLLGAVDDLVLLPIVLHALLSFLPARVRADFTLGAGRAP